jgi:hypothetical protein
MAKPFQFRLLTMFLLVAVAAFSTQLAILAWLSYRDLLVRLGQAVVIFSLAGIIWFAPFLPAVLRRRR